MRSPATPKNGEKSDPSHTSAPNTTNCSTDPVAVSTYQPRISVSISNATDVARSAGHWKRKLRTRKGATADARTARGTDGIRECYRSGRAAPARDRAALGARGHWVPFP